MLDGSGDGRPSLMGGQADADNPADNFLKARKLTIQYCTVHPYKQVSSPTEFDAWCWEEELVASHIANENNLWTLRPEA
jgi:hypothetical protein